MKAGRTVIAAAAAVSLLGVAGTAIADDGGGTSRAPSTATDPYVLPVAKGVHVKSLLTVDDAGSADGYEMVGIPDGLGASALSGGDFSVFMNHELPREKGIVRRHGQTGSFVSKLEIDEETLEVEEGSDLIDPGVRFWNYPTASYSSSPSPAGPNPRKAGDAFLAQMAAFTASARARSRTRASSTTTRPATATAVRIYFGNEEGGDESRTFGITESGRATQLPRLGLFSWENTVPARNGSDTTLSMGNEDTATGQLWSYIGKEQRSGSAVAEAGLTNGANYVMDIKDESISTDAQFRTKYGKGKDARFDLSEVSWDQSGKAQNTEAAAEGITLNRRRVGARRPAAGVGLRPRGGVQATRAQAAPARRPRPHRHPRDAASGLRRDRQSDADDRQAERTCGLRLANVEGQEWDRRRPPHPPSRREVKGIEGSNACDLRDGGRGLARHRVELDHRDRLQVLGEGRARPSKLGA